MKKIQDKYKIQTLSAFQSQPAPEVLPGINLITPLTPEAEKNTAQLKKIRQFRLHQPEEYKKGYFPK